jgi:hypothetical protein
MSNKPHIDEKTSAAFGAIRSAAALARHCDEVSATHVNVSRRFAAMVEANAIRAAIRAAIGSEKA